MDRIYRHTAGRLNMIDISCANGRPSLALQSRPVCNVTPSGVVLHLVSATLRAAIPYAVNLVLIDARPMNPQRGLWLASITHNDIQIGSIDINFLIDLMRMLVNCKDRARQ